MTVVVPELDCFLICYTKAQQNTVPSMGHRKLWLQGVSKGIC